MSKNQTVNRRKARPEDTQPGFYTGKKPNFMSRALAKPIDILGNLALTPKNMMEDQNPANMGNDPFGQDWYGKTGFHGETPVEGGMAPTTTMITPRPTHHYFDLLDGGKKQMNVVQLDQTVDLMNIKPHQAADAKARMAAKAENDAKIQKASSFIGKEPEIMQPPSKYAEPQKAMYYSPYKM